MSTIFGILFFLFGIGLVVGLINPKALLSKKDKAKGKKPQSRKNIGIGFGLICFICLVIGVVTTPPESDNQPVVKKQVAQSAPKPQTTSTVATISKGQAISTLSDATSFYSGLLTQGQQILGTTQYPNANAALAAMQDPSSMASKWSTFNTTSTQTDYFTTHVTQAFNTASDAYGDNTPTPLNDWNNDMNQTDADFHKWVQQATSWTNSEINNVQLATYTAIVQQDIAKSKMDISALGN